MILAPTLTLSAGSGAAIVRPTFSRDFAGEKTLNNGTGPAITFTRASGGTYFDANGVLQTASNDQPRFDHDPATGASRGLLIEESRTNSMIRSAEFDDAAWNKANTTVTANSATAPDGTASADTLTSSNSTAPMAINNTPQVAYAAATYTWSMFVKTNGWQWVQLRSSAALSSAFANFDIVNGVVGTASGATASLVNVGSGWFRIAVTFAAAAATGDWALNLVTATDSARNSSTTGNGTSGVYLWGAQLEAGAFPTSYIPTTDAAATRSADSAVVTPISSFYNQSEGTLFAEFSRPQVVKYSSFFAFNDGSGNEQLILESGFADPTVQRFQVFDGGVAQAQIGNYTSSTAGTIYRMCGAYAVNDFAVSQGGSSAATDTGGALPTVDRASLSVTPSACHIRKIAYYPRRLSNTLLQQLTT